MNCEVGKNCQKPGKLVIEFHCYLNKLTDSDGYLYEHDRLEYHKSLTIEVGGEAFKANLLIVFIISRINITRLKLKYV